MGNKCCKTWQVSEVLDYDRAADKPWTRLTQGDKVKKQKYFRIEINNDFLEIIPHAGLHPAGTQRIQVSRDGGDAELYI